MSIGLSKMLDGAGVIAVARLAGKWEPGEWELGRNNAGSLELELTRVIKGNVQPGRYRVHYSDWPHVSQSGGFVVFLSKGMCWRFAAHPISEGNTVQDGVLRVAGFYDYGCYYVYPGLVTLGQIETFVRDHTLHYTIRGPLYFPKRGQAAWEPSPMEVEVRYDARTGKAEVRGLPELKGFPAQPEAWVSPCMCAQGDEWVRLTWRALPDSTLRIEGQVESADPKTGALRARFFVDERTALTLAEFNESVSDPRKGRSFCTTTLLCAPVAGEVGRRELHLTLRGERGRVGELNGWPGGPVPLNEYHRQTDEGGQVVLRATAKLASGEELELRFDCGPKGQRNSQPADLVHLVAARDIPGKVLLRDGKGERGVASFTASDGKVGFTESKEPRSGLERSGPDAEQEGPESWTCESGGFEAVQDLVPGWAVLAGGGGLLAAAVGWWAWRRRRTAPRPG
jgi:hypothetical protein